MIEYIILGAIITGAVAFLIVRYYKIFTGKKGCCEDSPDCKCRIEGQTCGGSCGCGESGMNTNEGK